jgi:flagellar FliJ protein
MRFRYPFQKLLDLKTNEKTQAEWMLSEAIGILRQEESTLSELYEARNQVNSRMADVSAGLTTVSQLKLLQDYAEHLDQQIMRKNRDVRQAQHLVHEKQQHLSAKMIEEKIWTKAKDKAYAQFVSAVLKKEQEEMDEIAMTRRVRTI